jgi:hypothetical protein
VEKRELEFPGNQPGRRYPFDQNGRHVLSADDVANIKRNARPGELPLDLAGAECYNLK